MLAQIDSQTQVSYLDFGHGRPVVLLHAFPLAKEMWEIQISDLAEEYRVLALDAPGFGESSPFDGVPSIEAAARRVAAFLEAVEIDQPVILGGLSMGGYTALAFARLFPERLAALILADTKAEPDDEAGKAKREEMIAFVEEKGGDAVIDKMLPAMLSPLTLQERPEVVETVKSLGKGQQTKTITDAIAALRDRPDARPGLAAIQVPTLVIGGVDDQAASPEVMSGLAKGIANARHEIIPAAGHLSNLEQPQVFSEILKDFLESLSSG
jgi:pimeloyl-ACP methyl ester carboxylesterase